MSATQAAWPRGIYTSQQVREFDRFAIGTLGIDGFELMQRAGRSALTFLQGKWPDAATLLIYCGAGNNAGDGYVLAALAAGEGIHSRVLAVVDPDSLTGEAAAAVQLARKADIRIEAFTAGPVGPGQADADIVVDALLGTGLSRDVDGAIADAVRRINASPRPVLALDVPTGIDGDTGAIRGVAVEADATISFVGLKSGLYLGAGVACRGDLGFSALGLPPEVFADAVPVLRRLDSDDPAQLLKRRSRVAHKGMNGNVLVVGGAVGMAGAARLAAEAALRSGAGLVHAAVAPESVAAVMAGRPEIMCRGVSDSTELADLVAAASVIVVGPGLSRSRWGESMAEAILAADCALVVDADALNYLAEHPTRRANWVLTPHPGEAARLLGRSTRDVQLARDEAAADIAERYGAVTVLKGACSLVAQAIDNKGISISVCDYGNPGMASGGMGDVLAGVIGGLIAQCGLVPAVAEAGVLVHALAGDDAARDGERGLIASDLFWHLRRRVNPA
jgi:NAD(P)H-hydrate epimerase